MKKSFFAITFLVSSFALNGQILFSNGANIFVKDGAIVHSNGGTTFAQGSWFENDGHLTVTKNSTLGSAGNFEINSGSTAAGDGIYRVEQDWINSATFQGGSSEVILFGDTEQKITSDNGTMTDFNSLTLEGTGVGVDRRKSLVGVNSSSSSNGVLNLNDRELNTNGFDFVVHNSSPLAVTNSTDFEDEGFVSSVDDGYLIWLTNQSDTYLVPVGSSIETRRYRPIQITPLNADEHFYGVRFNNYSAQDDGYSLTSYDESIGEVNKLFYHSIEDLTGDSKADLGFYFIPSQDHNWDSYANWNSSAAEWQNALISVKDEDGGFKFIANPEWDFPEADFAYVLVDYDYTVTVYEVLSPNGDGLNDAFIVEGIEFYPNSEVWIYNRWGEEVFHSEDYKNDWFGISQSKLNVGGDELPEGTYYYILRLGGPDELEASGELFKGFVYLKR